MQPGISQDAISGDHHPAYGSGIWQTAHQACSTLNACETLAPQVIEPIQSRCAILRFRRLSDAELLARILYVCQAEKARQHFW